MEKAIAVLYTVYSKAHVLFMYILGANDLENINYKYLLFLTEYNITTAKHLEYKVVKVTLFALT